MSLALRSGHTIVFAGDSITDCGRRGDHAPLGNGYAKLVLDLVVARHPSLELRAFNAGVSGDTVRDLERRWSDDVIARQPDWLSVLVGINDLYATLNGGERAVPPEAYAACYRALLERARAETPAELLLLDPFYMARDPAPGSLEALVLERLPAYLDVVAGLAEEFGARHLRTHALFQELLASHPADRFCPEPVHPNQSGHVAIASAYLSVLEGWN